MTPFGGAFSTPGHVVARIPGSAVPRTGARGSTDRISARTIGYPVIDRSRVIPLENRADASIHYRAILKIPLIAGRTRPR